MDLKYADLRRFDASNWEGIQTTIFFSGCTFHCEGCFNKVAQDFNYGNEYSKGTEDKIIEFAKSNKVDGVCLLGGEPFQQDLDLILRLVKRIKSEVNKPIHVWSGYLLEDLLEDRNKRAILEYVDTLVDGQFEIDKRDLNLKLKGSSNQRVIDVQQSLRDDKIVGLNL